MQYYFLVGQSSYSCLCDYIIKYEQTRFDNMMLSNIILLLTLALFAQSKRQKYFFEFTSPTSSSIIYLSRMDIGKGNATVDIIVEQNTKKTSLPTAYIKIGILKHDRLQQFITSTSCQEKVSLFEQVSAVEGNISFIVIQNDPEGYYYLYVVDCRPQRIENLTQPESFVLDIKFMNNGSHFGEDENLVPEYLLLIGLWLYFVIRYGLQILKQLQKQNQKRKFFLYIGFFCHALAYFYKMLSLLVIYLTGLEILILDNLSEIIKYLIQGGLLGVIISIAFGWSIMSIKTSDQFCVLLGISIGILNVICILYDSAQNHQNYYNRGQISILMITSAKLLVFIVFIIGTRRSMLKSAGKVRQFMQKFEVWGGLYLLSWPIGLFICQFLLPKYKHQEFMVMIEESLHVVCNAMMCYWFSFPTSQYKKIEKTQAMLPE